MPRRGWSAEPKTEALEAVEGFEGDFAAEGIAARVRLAEQGVGGEAFAKLDDGEREAALDGLLEAIADADQGAREDLRRTIVGILSEFDPADPVARKYRKRLATALY